MRRTRLSWAFLVAVLLFDVWLRGHAFGPAIRDRTGVDLYPVTSAEPEPLDCDEAIYGYIGKQIASGAVMYRDLTENKPPGGYWLYALFIKIGGATEFTVRVLPLPFVLGTIVLVWWVAGRLGGPFAAGLGALTFAAVSTDPFLYGESANMEHMINVFAFGSLALLVAGWSRPGRAWILAAGAALGAACLIKQTSALHAPVYCLALLLRQHVRNGESDERRSFRSRVLDVTALIGGFAAVLGLAVAVVVVQGAGPQAFDDVFRYGRALATETPAPPNAPPWWVRWVTGNADPLGRLPWPFGSTTYLVWWGSGTWPFWLSGLAGLGWLLLGRGSTGPRRLVAAWTLSAWVQVALPGLFWQHYYLLPLPGLAVAVAVLFVDQWLLFRAGSRRWVRAAIGLLILVALIETARLQVVEYLRVAPVDLVKDRGGPQWVVDRSLGREIARRAKGLDRPTLFVWGWQGPLYFYSGLDGVTRQVFVDDFLKNFAGSDHPLVAPRIDRTMRDLLADPPSVVFSGYPPFPRLQQFLEERYLPSRLAPGLWVRRDRYGAFEKASPR